MKKILFFTVLITICLGLYAQVSGTATHSFKRHEIRFGVGDPLVQRYYLSPIYTRQSLSFSRVFSRAPYDGFIHTTLPISVGYRYRALTWLWVGGDVNFIGYFGRPASGSTVEPFNSFMVHASLAVRFSYLNREMVTLYSEYSHGIVGWSKNVVARERMLSQFTLIGVEFGCGRWFGSAELGIGYKGLLNVGVGCRL